MGYRNSEGGYVSSHSREGQRRRSRNRRRGGGSSKKARSAWKGRPGGIDPSLWGAHGGSFGKQTDLWEAAAHRMGLMQVDTPEKMTTLMNKFNSLGIQDFDSYNDVAQFGDNWGNQAVQANIDSAVASAIETRWEAMMEEMKRKNPYSGLELTPQAIEGGANYVSPYANSITNLVELMARNQGGQQATSPWLAQGAQAGGWAPTGGW